MRLINVATLQLEEFMGTQIPPYTILSHTWGLEEVTLQELPNLQTATLKTGFSKIAETCEQARRIGIGYVWVDTCCIDKTSSA